MKISPNYIIRKWIVPMFIGALPTILFGYRLNNWQWWAVAIPVSLAWSVLDNTLVETFIQAWKERRR